MKCKTCHTATTIRNLQTFPLLFQASLRTQPSTSGLSSRLHCNKIGSPCTCSANSDTDCRIFILSLCLTIFPRLLRFLSETGTEEHAKVALSPLESFLALHFGIILAAIAAALVLNVSSYDTCSQNRPKLLLRCLRRIQLPLGTKATTILSSCHCPSRVASVLSWPITRITSVLYPRWFGSFPVPLVDGAYGPYVMPRPQVHCNRPIVPSADAVCGLISCFQEDRC